MGDVRRIFVEKKEAFAGAAQDLAHELRSYLGLKSLTGLRILIRYDVENLPAQVYLQARDTVFSEPPVDRIYEESFPAGASDRIFAVEYLPGQFDQRADSAIQCVRLLNESVEPLIRTATVYVCSGSLSDAQIAKIQDYVCNPVDSRICSDQKPETLRQQFAEPQEIGIYEGFTGMDQESLRSLYDSLSLAMTFRDFEMIQEYFASDRMRDPTVTEIRVLDTYWSDHCRHTTFSTRLNHISIGEGALSEPVKNALEEYLRDRDDVYGKGSERDICLMDLAVMGAKKLKKDGLLEDQEETDEINACSIIVPAVVDGQTQEWLIQFKNETHNHPTEIEPFGGAATCLGGAIRDPLSGRAYVYQAMRVTGAADPTASMEQTMKGKLPQKKLVREAARGYSSYGNQVGLATGYVKEIYHPAYAAKRMEIGAVIAAAPRSDVIRESVRPGDVVILLGGRTGRDGIGGATGSSKAHTASSIDTCGAEVQKGNAPTERKIQRLFRRGEVSRLIRKCNDFGAGGVAVAIGELADGLRINLDTVPKKYAGLDGTELAISESQERMAVVVAREDVETFLACAAQENLEAVETAVVTEQKNLVMTWRGKTIVDVSRAFLNTNGAKQETDVRLVMPEGESFFPKRPVSDRDVRKILLGRLSDLNGCSQRGLVEMFDSSIGAGSVLMPFGGRYQRTQTQVMAAKLPVRGGECDTVTLMAYGFDPYLSSWSPFHGASFAVCTGSLRNIISPELKKAGSRLVLVRVGRDEYDLPDYEAALRQYGAFSEDLKKGRILSAYVVDAKGFLYAACQMAFGNRLGLRIEHNVAPEDLFAPDFGAILCEVKDSDVSNLQTEYTVVGVVEDTGAIEYRDTRISLEEAQECWEEPLEKIFRTRPVRETDENASVPEGTVPYNPDIHSRVFVSSHGFARPRVFIPVFPGTNCEYDSARAFERAGAITDVRVFRNLSSEDIRQSAEEYAAAIDQAQILMFPGGFSAGDEPDGSAKFFAAAFRNERIRDAVERLLNERDGLILGICNGFQALIKLGLVPEGKILPGREDSPTLTFNTLHRHISHMVSTKVMSTKSPWLAGAKSGGVYVSPENL